MKGDASKCDFQEAVLKGHPLSLCETYEGSMLCRGVGNAQVLGKTACSGIQGSKPGGEDPASVLCSGPLVWFSTQQNVH